MPKLQVVNNSGQSLIELILAIAIASIFLVSFILGIIGVREGYKRSSINTDAKILLQKEIEALRSIKETNWNSFATAGTYHVVQSGSSWTIANGTSVDNNLTHGFSVYDVCRFSANTPIVDCSSPGSIVDPSVKKIVNSVDYDFLGSKTISQTLYLTRSNNSFWEQTSKADFDNGIFNNTRSTNNGGGDVQLRIGGGQSFTDDYDNSSDYIFDSNKVEVVGGFAQLKAQGSTVSGSTTNSNFDSNANGWAFSSWGHNISQSGLYQSAGGNPGGNVNINLPQAKNKKSGGYWYQPFTTTVANPTATLDLDWSVTGFSGVPDSFHVYAFVDTGSGSPTIGQNIWDSGNISGVSSWSSVINIDVSSKIAAPGTYYLKLAIYVDYKNINQGPYSAAFDNVKLSWSKTIGGYPTDNPTVERTISFVAPSINSWNSFTATSVLNGGSIGYQLSDNDGVTWKYFDGLSWVNTILSTNYNDEATVNSQIAGFPTANNSILVRAFFISNGSQFIRLDKIEISYTGTETGTYISDTFISGNQVSFNRISWTEFGTLGTTIKFQLAINNDNLTWNFVGPDGTNSTYYTGGQGTVPITYILGQYLRFQIYFTGSTGQVPGVTEVTVNYSI